ncbi:hypothetical protein PCANC_27697 [Puccinia coronata f. sp. avenae]|uniref:Uncharacterized protein n=1 Tax=Puccinia coronata f. sp. avenae TaxID=200324 RepID=A0A2N5S7Y2_9BASI|nr:hypothetical protein PCANC_27697 [Puccinia coronata f. sp. avenae]
MNAKSALQLVTTHSHHQSIPAARQLLPAAPSHRLLPPSRPSGGPRLAPAALWPLPATPSHRCTLLPPSRPSRPISTHPPQQSSRAEHALVHGKVRLMAESDDQDSRKIPISLKAWEGVECHWEDHAMYSQLTLIVSCKSLAIPPTVISFPTHTINKLHAYGIKCMDVAGEWIVTGGKNSTLRLDPWLESDPSETSLSHRTGRGHLSDITSSWVDELDDCAILYGPPQPQWSWPGAPSISVRGIHVAPKRFLDSTGTPAPLIASQSQDSPLFPVLALSSGALHFADLPSLKPIKLRTLCITMDHAADSPMEALAVLRSAKLISWGTRTGTLGIAMLHWHLPGSSSSACLGLALHAQSVDGEDGDKSVLLTPLASWRRTTAAVNSLQFVNHDAALLVARNNGLPYRISFAAPQPVILKEFAGYNCNPVAAIRLSCTYGQVFSAGKDGNVLVWNRPPSHSPLDS